MKDGVDVVKQRVEPCRFFTPFRGSMDFWSVVVYPVGLFGVDILESPREQYIRCR